MSGVNPYVQARSDLDSTVGVHPSASEEFVTMRERSKRIG